MCLWPPVSVNINIAVPEAVGLKLLCHISTDSCAPPLSHQSESEMGAMAFKADILSLLRVDISAVIKSELKNALTEEFRSLKSKLKEVKS